MPRHAADMLRHDILIRHDCLCFEHVYTRRVCLLMFAHNERDVARVRQMPPYDAFSRCRIR